MKVTRFIAIAGFAAMLFAACEQVKPNADDTTSPAELLSFGFYAEDNESLLDKDYVASVISEETIIRIPDGGAGKTLVARVEVGDNDVATVNESEVVDGKVTVDATYPIDIIVTDSESGLSSAYVVKVGKILGLEMTPLLTYTEPDATLSGRFHMQINPEDGQPYIAYLSEKTDKENQVSVIRWTGSSFEAVGALGFTEGADGSRARYPSIAFDNDGKPVVAARYDGNPDNEMSVYTYSGSWSMLGHTSEEASSLYEPTVFVSPSDNYPVVMYLGNNVLKHMMVVSKYDGSAMTTATAMSPSPAVDGSTGAFSRTRAVKVGDAVYVLAVFNGAGYWLYKYENNSWTAVIQKFYETNTHFTCISLKADGQGNLYAMFAADNETTGDYKIKLYKVDLENATFIPVGSPIASCTARTSVYFDFAVNPVNGQIAAVQIGSEDDGIYFGYIDQETGDWEEFVKVGSKTAGDYPYIGFSADGKGYAAFSTDDGIDLFSVGTEEDILPE